MDTAKRILFLSIMAQISLSVMLLASMTTMTAAAGAPADYKTVPLEIPRQQIRMRRETPTPTSRLLRRRTNNDAGRTETIMRRLSDSPEFTSGSVDEFEDEDEDEEDDDDDDDYVRPASSTKGTHAAAATATAQKQNELCTPMAECELCPHNWKVLIEKEDEKIKGEYDSCVKHGRRRQFECTVLFQESKKSEKSARSQYEFRPCRYTETDEQYRVIRMQMICLLVGVWFMRNVRRQKVVSASLFDQRRMRIQNSVNGSSSGSSVKKYPALQRMDSMETVELMPTTGWGKMPKSPAPDPDFQTV